ncbi:metallophosphoesterase [Phormidium tenue FACHB-886]|nr:metallophosphoesterase [Phormidium tenue FACHB-886]
MPFSFRFAVLSDPHIALPQTIWNHPSRFHLVEISIPALEVVLQELEPLDLDFLLIPGDLTQHGEPENHAWLADRLAQLPYPVCVIPGNHDVIEREATGQSIGLLDFPQYYQKFGYDDPTRLCYCREILPGVQVIGLNSNAFDSQGKQAYSGHLDETQLVWLQQTLQQVAGDLVLVMIHHNVIEHLPNQAKSPLGRRYMLDNSSALLEVLQEFNAQLLFTGHLHVQDVAQYKDIYEITTGSLVSYPHPYRILRFEQDDRGRQIKIESGRVRAVPTEADLQALSREWMGDRSLPFMLKLLTQPPLNLTQAKAEELAPTLRYFWADIADGDTLFHFPDFPPAVGQYFTQFGAVNSEGKHEPIDNDTVLLLKR